MCLERGLRRDSGEKGRMGWAGLGCRFGLGYAGPLIWVTRGFRFDLRWVWLIVLPTLEYGVRLSGSQPQPRLGSHSKITLTNHMFLFYQEKRMKIVFDQPRFFNSY